MQIIYRWAFSVAPALCPSPPHSRNGGARAPTGYMALALVMSIVYSYKMQTEQFTYMYSMKTCKYHLVGNASGTCLYGLECGAADDLCW